MMTPGILMLHIRRAGSLTRFIASTRIVSIYISLRYPQIYFLTLFLHCKVGSGPGYRDKCVPCHGQRVFTSEKAMWRVIPHPPAVSKTGPELVPRIDFTPSNGESWSEIGRSTRVTAGDISPFYKEVGWIGWHDKLPEPALERLRHASALSAGDGRDALLLHTARTYMSEVFLLCNADTAYVRERLGTPQK